MQLKTFTYYSYNDILLIKKKNYVIVNSNHEYQNSIFFPHFTYNVIIICLIFSSNDGINMLFLTFYYII